MSQHRGWLLGLGCFGFGLATSWLLGWGLPLSTPAHGQFGQVAAVAQEQFADEATTPAERQRIYTSLQDSAHTMQQHSNILRQVAKVVGPTVVHLEAEKVDRNVRRFGFVEEAGSGVIVSIAERPGKAFVLTNSHVVHGAELERIKIRLSDSRELKAKELWEDPQTDIAVIEVDSRGIVTSRLGDSDGLEIGDFVLAVGSPFGLSHSMTFGIVSAKGRRDLALGDDQVKYQDFIQTDAAINPGNSGGPLINMQGEVVGINTAIASNSGGNEGIGFSIPINMVVRVAEQLIERGSVSRAFLGVTLDPKFGPATAARLGLPAPRGARVAAVRENTPASEINLQSGDVILEFNGIRVDDDAHLINIVSLTEVGEAVPMVVWRDRKAFRINVRVGDRAKLERSVRRTPEE